MTIVEFADLQCPACKSALPVVQKLLADAPNARFVFQQFPLTQMHHWAFAAAEYGECVHRENPAAFWKFVDAVYGAQEQISADTNNSEDAGKKAEAKLQELAAAAGVDGKRVAACAQSAGNRGAGEAVGGAGEGTGDNRHAHAVHRRAQDQQPRAVAAGAVEADGGFHGGRQVIRASGVTRPYCLCIAPRVARRV